ncbi:MAG TPA: hypothetical protein VFX16_13900 [Pseudonocardiaceae bacterium]|nr:hypothetical protein [Pseudonocardiaceae bacterium]
MEVHRQLGLGASPQDAVALARPFVARVFDLLEHGLADYPA